MKNKKKTNKEKDEISKLIMLGYFPYIPCVHCGYCCNKVPCAYAVQFGKVDDNGKCTQLYKEGNDYLCHWATCPTMSNRLSIGAGCSSSLNSTRKEKIKNGFSSKNIQPKRI